MIILRSWLQDYIEIPWSGEELVLRLTNVGSLVDSYYQTLDPNIVIAKILEVNTHPNADKLSLAKVTDGIETYDVVCGAPNIATGQIVPLAKIGAKIGDHMITAATIRGQVSHGMLCSELELGLGENHEGILILDENAELGQPLSSIYGTDLIMDLEITPNRGDCLSHLGIAREVASLLGKTISKEPLSLPMIHENANDSLKVSTKDLNLCPRYLVRLIKNVKIAPSPEWLQRRLALCGLKPINNVVDITNYIMLDLGQPLHAFDASKVGGGEIIVRLAKNGEQITTLDNTVRTLSNSTIVIADSQDPLAIAGVMGGLNSQITETTTDIILEAAEFNRVSIRKTSKTLGLQSDASYRFERGIDPALVEYALNKAAKMIHELASGDVFSGIAKFESAIPTTTIALQDAKINELLGTDLSKDQLKHILKSRGFKSDGDSVIVPSWRQDITIWQDLAEEIACVVGLHNIKLVPVPKTASPAKSSYYYKEHLKDLLVKSGFSEVYNYSFMSEQDIVTAKISSKDLLEVANPVSPENKFMRNSLVPGMLTAVSKNPTFDPILLFEIGQVFTRDSENTKLCIATAGSGSEKMISKAIGEISAVMKLSGEERTPRSLSRDELNQYKIKKPMVYLVEIDISEIKKKMKVEESKLKLKLSHKEIIYRPVSKYPSVTRDLAFIVDKDVDPEAIEKLMYGISSLVNNIELFDEFASDKFGTGKKNVAYHVFLQAPDRTLKDDEANAAISEIVGAVAKQYKAKLRDK